MKCFQSGHYPVTRCPREEVTADVIDAIEAARFARAGAWPRTGGTLEQTVVCLAAFRVAWDAEDAVRREMQLETDSWLKNA